MTPDPYACEYCGRRFPVAIMRTHHQATNQCGLVTEETESCGH